MVEDNSVFSFAFNSAKTLVGFAPGKECMRTVVRTTGRATHIELAPYNNVIYADGEDGNVLYCSTGEKSVK